MRLVQQTESVQELLCKYPHQGGAQPSELVLFDQLVKIDAEQLKGQTQVLLVNKGIFQSKQMVVVVLVVLAVELYNLDISRRSKHGGGGNNSRRRTKSRTETSIILWLKYAVLFLMTLTATTSCVLRFWHLTTCPKVPWPSTSRMRYRFLQQSVSIYHRKKRRVNALVTCIFTAQKSLSGISLLLDHDHV